MIFYSDTAPVMPHPLTARLLFQAAAETLRAFGRNRLAGEIGFAAPNGKLDENYEQGLRNGYAVQ